jgi:acetate kinase
MNHPTLTLNAGSSTLKFALYAPALLAHGLVETVGEGGHFAVRDAAGTPLAEARWAGTEGFHAAALARLLAWQREAFPALAIGAVGHRVVHGGIRYNQAVLLDDAVLDFLESLVPLAPLHQPHNLAGIRAARAAWPGIPQVACFDTAFHRGHAFVADTFGLPRAYYDQGIRRYGFHGLSYDHISRRLREIDPEGAGGRVIVAHLGAGASMCAIRDGRSVATSMGFTALDGLPMGTRTGQIDPGVVLHLLGTLGMSLAEVTDLFYRRSGLLGLSGLSSDMRTLLASDAPAARDAIDYFVFRLRREIGALAAALGGLDTLVFTAGIGEHAAPIRAAALAGMEWLGLVLDPAANEGGPAERVISTPDSGAKIRIIPADEEATILREVRELLAT